MYTKYRTSISNKCYFQLSQHRPQSTNRKTASAEGSFWPIRSMYRIRAPNTSIIQFSILLDGFSLFPALLQRVLRDPTTNMHTRYAPDARAAL